MGVRGRTKPTKKNKEQEIKRKTILNRAAELFMLSFRSVSRYSFPLIHSVDRMTRSIGIWDWFCRLYFMLFRLKEQRISKPLSTFFCTLSLDIRFSFIHCFVLIFFFFIRFYCIKAARNKLFPIFTFFSLLFLYQIEMKSLDVRQRF